MDGQSEHVVAEWKQKSLQLLNEQFSIIREINELKKNCETDLEDLNHQIQLYQIKLNSSKHSMENFVLKGRSVETVRSNPLLTRLAA